jgi:hypothetical protein
MVLATTSWDIHGIYLVLLKKIQLRYTWYYWTRAPVDFQLEVGWQHTLDPSSVPATTTWDILGTIEERLLLTSNCKLDGSIQQTPPWY